MTQREKILLMSVVGVLVLWAGWQGVGKYQAALENLRDQSREAQGELGSAKLELLQSDEAMQNLDRWQEESLPEDPEVAQTAYRAWLVDRLGESGLRFNNVRRVGARPEGEAYTAITYTAHADGKLDQITRFLHTFYDSPQLHKITVLKLTPMPEKGELAMDVSIEALIVHGTTRQEGIAEGTSGRLALENVEAYVDSIQGRNLFAQYTPPPPPRPKPPPKAVVETPPPPPKPEFDDAKHAFVSGIIGNGDRYEVWVNVRTTGESLHLYEGDAIKVGQFNGRITSIDKMSIVVESDGESLRVPLGSPLGDGKPVSSVELL